MLQAVFLLGYAAVLMDDQPSTSAVAALAAAMGLADAIHSSAVTGLAGLLGEEGDSEGQGEVQGLAGSVGRTAVLLATPAAGALLGWHGSSAPVVAAVLVLVALVLLVRVQPFTRPHVAQDPDVSTISMVREGFQVVLGNPLIRLVFVIFSLTNLFLTPPLLLAMPLMADEFGWGSFAYGSVFAAMAAGGILGGLALAKWRSRIRRPVLTALLTLLPTTGFLVLFVVAENPWVAGVAVFFESMFTAPAPALMIAEVRSKTESRLLGRVMALQTMAIYSFIPVGFITYGALAEATSLRTTGLMFCAAMLVATLGGLAAQRRLPAEFGDPVPEQAD